MHCGAFWCIYRRWLFSPQTQEVGVEVGVMGKEVTKVSSQIRNCFDFSPSECNKRSWVSGWNYFFLYALSNYQGHLLSLKQTTGRINNSNRILFFLCQHTHILTVMSTLMPRFPDILDGGTSRMDAVVAQVLFINRRYAWIVMTIWWENRRATKDPFLEVLSRNCAMVETFWFVSQKQATLLSSPLALFVSFFNFKYLRVSL